MKEIEKEEEKAASSFWESAGVAGCCCGGQRFRCDVYLCGVIFCLVGCFYSIRMARIK
jgi:hypothetical protein